MPRANEIKKGMVLNYNGKLLLVKDIDIQSPTARGAATLYKMRFSDVRTGLKVEERFKGVWNAVRVAGRVALPLQFPALFPVCQMASPPILPAFSLMNSNAVKFSPRHCDRKSVQAYKPALKCAVTRVSRP